MMPNRCAVLMLAVVLAFAPARRACAQTASDLAAFDAFVVSPFGALPPLARDYAGGLPPRADFSVRYGRWRYDVNDAIHNNGGATVSLRLGQSSTTVDLSGAYMALSCDCRPWISSALGVRTTLLSTAAGPPNRPGLSAHVAVAGMIGTALYASIPHSSATVAQATLDVGAAIPLPWGTRLAMSVYPGYAGGHLMSDDLTDGGRGRTIAGALAWVLPKGVTIDVGAQRFVLSGAPTEYGAAVSWSRR